MAKVCAHLSTFVTTKALNQAQSMALVSLRNRIKSQALCAKVPEHNVSTFVTTKALNKAQSMTLMPLHNRLKSQAACAKRQKLNALLTYGKRQNDCHKVVTSSSVDRSVGQLVGVASVAHFCNGETRHSVMQMFTIHLFASPEQFFSSCRRIIVTIHKKQTHYATTVL